MNAEYVKAVVRRLYDAQKLRQQSDLRLQRLVRDGIVLKENAEKTFKRATELDAKIEREYERIVWREIRHEPIVERWLVKVKGIGPRLSGLLVANIGDIGRFETPAKLFAYCGLHVKDGRAVRRQKGEKSNWSQELKTTAWKIAQSFVKCGGPYREIYDRYKDRIVAREVSRGNVIWKKEGNAAKWVVAHAPKGADTTPKKDNPEWSLGRINNMALRRVAKMFLEHLWRVWREIEGLPVREPYALEHQAHTTFIDPWSMIEKTKEEAA